MSRFKVTVSERQSSAQQSDHGLEPVAQGCNGPPAVAQGCQDFGPAADSHVVHPAEAGAGALSPLSD
jgi:hypothetical protein